MTTNQLTYFISVAECLNFTEAAKKHFISQTAMTQRIQTLEDQLGVRLFDRSRRHVELTPAGKVFLQEARAILEMEHRALEKVEAAAAGISGSIQIGYVKGYETSDFRHVLKTFHENHRDISFELYRENYLDLLLHLEQGKYDVILDICYNDTDLSAFAQKVVASYPLYAVLYADHPLAGHNALYRNELKNERFLLSKFYEDPMAIGYMLPDKYADSGFIPKVAATSPDIETLLLMVAARSGITILPENALGQVKSSADYAVIPLIGAHEHIEVKAIWKKENQNPALSKFLELLP